jgi:hypothetical protein
MEYAVKAQRPLITLFFLFCTGLPALGQEASMGGPAYTALHAAPAPTDRQSPGDADQTSGNIAASLSEHLVVFESRRDPENKRLGIPFTAFANSPMHLAYDPASRQMMAQWTFGSLGLIGHRLQYQAYMDVSGALSFVFSARF